MSNPIANLHTIFNRPWLIEAEYAQSLYPLLHNVLAGKSFDNNDEEEKIVSFVNFDVQGNANTVATDIAELNTDAIAVIDVHTPILKYSQMCGPTGTQELMEIMDDLKVNTNIKAILIDMDSGGGQVSGTAEFAHYIKAYPKPVGIYSNGMIASAAYYIASAGAHITVNPHADRIGSLGAYIEFLDLTGYIEKAGAKKHTIYASKSTEKNQEFREAINGNYTPMINKVLDPIVAKFHADTKAFRPQLDLSKVDKGAMFQPQEALEAGLIDAIGTRTDALVHLLELVEN